MILYLINSDEEVKPSVMHLALKGVGQWRGVEDLFHWAVQQICDAGDHCRRVGQRICGAGDPYRWAGQRSGVGDTRQEKGVALATPAAGRARGAVTPTQTGQGKGTDKGTTAVAQEDDFFDR